MFLFEDLGMFVVAYFDDICIFSTNAAEHMQHVKIVSERLAKYGMHINKKSQWFKTDVDFLGHQITASGILPVSRKIDEVASFVSPINVSELRGYLGLFSYYRKFIHKFAEKEAVLYDLLKKNTKFVWSDKFLHLFSGLNCTKMLFSLLRTVDNVWLQNRGADYMVQWGNESGPQNH